jgi:proteic killer suppression protein
MNPVRLSFLRLLFVSSCDTNNKMITGFRHKGLESFYRTGSLRGIQPVHADKLRRILAALDAASSPGELNLPAYRLNPLKGGLSGFWSIWVSGNWRLTFRFNDSDTELLDYVDYH